MWKGRLSRVHVQRKLENHMNNDTGTAQKIESEMTSPSDVYWFALTPQADFCPAAREASQHSMVTDLFRHEAFVSSPIRQLTLSHLVVIESILVHSATRNYVINKIHPSYKKVLSDVKRKISCLW